MIAGAFLVSRTHRGVAAGSVSPRVHAGVWRGRAECGGTRQSELAEDLQKAAVCGEVQRSLA